MADDTPVHLSSDLVDASAEPGKLQGTAKRAEKVKKEKEKDPK